MFTEFSAHTDLQDAYRKECVSSIKRLAADAHRRSQTWSDSQAPLSPPLINRLDVKPGGNHVA